MSKIVWDASSKRLFETGVDHVVFYPINSDGSFGNGVAWNGVTGITESPEGAEANDIYADNIKYLSLISAENWKGTIKAYTFPDPFYKCQGEYEYFNKDGHTGAGLIDGIFFGQQKRSKFALSWRSLWGNDTDGDSYAYKIHIAYGLSAAPSERDHATVNDSPEATEFSWEISSIPMGVSTEFTIDGESVEIKPVSHLVFESKNPVTGADNPKIGLIENTLYGYSSYEPSMKTPDQWISLLTA